MLRLGRLRDAHACSGRVVVMEGVRAVSMVGAAHSMRDLRRPSRGRVRQAAVEETKDSPRCRGHGKSSHGWCGSKAAGMTRLGVCFTLRATNTCLTPLNTTSPLVAHLHMIEANIYWVMTKPKFVVGTQHQRAVRLCTHCLLLPPTTLPPTHLLISSLTLHRYPTYHLSPYYFPH